MRKERRQEGTERRGGEPTRREPLTQEEKLALYPKDQYGGLKGQCIFEAAFGRCGLRGTVEVGGGKICTFHHHIRGRDLSLDSFRHFMAEEINAGDESWLRHDDIWWWDRITGRKGPFSSTAEDLVRSRECENEKMRRIGRGAG